MLGHFRQLPQSRCDGFTNSTCPSFERHFRRRSATCRVTMPETPGNGCRPRLGIATESGLMCTRGIWSSWRRKFCRDAACGSPCVLSQAKVAFRNLSTTLKGKANEVCVLRAQTTREGRVLASAVRERGARALTVSFAHRLVAGPPMPAAKKRRTRAALKGGGLPMSFDFSLIQDTAAEGLFHLRPAVKLARALCQQKPLHLWLKSRNSISDVPLIADLRVLREFYKTPEGKAVLKEAGFGEEGRGAYEIDHIYPRSPSCPGSGINHVCNLFLLSPAENQFFRDHADLLKVKLGCIGEVLCTFFCIFLHCNALLHLIA